MVRATVVAFRAVSCHYSQDISIDSVEDLQVQLLHDIAHVHLISLALYTGFGFFWEVESSWCFKL